MRASRSNVLPRDTMLGVNERPPEFQFKSWSENFSSLHHVSMAEHAVHFWQRELDASRMFSNVSYKIWKPYNQFLSSNTNMTNGVTKLLFAEFMLDMGHPEGVTERLPQVRADLKPVPEIAHLLGTFFRTRGTILNF